MGVSLWKAVFTPLSHNGATRFNLPGVPVAPYNSLVGRILVLATLIRIVVIAHWRHACRCFATQTPAMDEFLGLVSEAVAWHCFAIQSQSGRFFGWELSLQI